MLIKFKVSNFRSIGEEQTLDLIANNLEGASENLTNISLRGLTGAKILKGAGIFGPNASGKSNILSALYFLSNFVENSATKLNIGDPTRVEPFLLDENLKNQPSKFEITFITNGVRYTLGVSLTSQRVVEEYLFAYPKGSRLIAYHRVYNLLNNAYEWRKASSSYKQDKNLRQHTRDNALYLSVASQFNNTQLIPIYQWFKDKLRFIDCGSSGVISPTHTASLLKNDSYYSKLILLLKEADIDIEDAKIEEHDVSMDELSRKMPPEVVEILKRDDPQGSIKQLDISLKHKSSGPNPIWFNLEESESDGTKRFFSLIGPWLESLTQGYVLVVDEINTSLHPKLVRALLKLFFGDTNNKGAQIIFTSHDVTLLDQTLIRRDQIWFTEKTNSSMTNLYPLTDFSPRAEEAIIKGYLAGRYGAIPYMPNGLNFIN